MDIDDKIRSFAMANMMLEADLESIEKNMRLNLD